MGKNVIGSLLIDIAASTARLENDLGKANRAIDKAAGSWTKSLSSITTVLGSAGMLLAARRAAAAVQDFVEAGLRAGEQMGSMAGDVAKFRAEQQQLSVAMGYFAAEVIRPLLPVMQDTAAALAGVARSGRETYRAMVDLSGSMGWIGDGILRTTALGAAYNALAESSARLAQEERARREAEAVVDMSEIDAWAAQQFDAEARAEADREKLAVAARAREQERLRREAAEATKAATERLRLQHAAEAQAAREWEQTGEAARRLQEEQERERQRVEDETLAQTYAGRRELLQRQKDSELAIVAGSEAEQAAVRRRYAEQERAMTAARYSARMAQMTSAMGMATNLLGATLGEHHAMTKSFAVAEALINTYAGVTQALRYMKPPESWIMAGTTLAMGLRQVQAIRSTSPGGGGGATSVGGGGGVVTTTDTATEPAAQDPLGQTVKQRTGGPSTTITIQNMIGSRTWVERELLPLLNEASRSRAEVIYQ